MKGKFPHLKIGGPAIAGNTVWGGEEFVREMRKRGVPLNFFSWYIYTTEPRYVSARGECVRNILDKYGYESTESILNEWNYVSGWTDKYVSSIETIHGIKGAAFTLACMYAVQEKEILLDFGKEKSDAKYEMRLLDETHDGEFMGVSGDLTLKLKPNTCILVKEI